MRVLIGYDPAEHASYVIARYSIERRALSPVTVSPLKLELLQDARVYRRPIKRISGQMWDVISDAPMSTEFAISRFYVPHLQDDHDDWMLFVDSDIVCLSNIHDIMKYADESKAIQVVKHEERQQARPIKKVDKTQTLYPRKNWSSVMLWNVKHPSHKKLTYDMLNTVPGRELHRFCWLTDDEIGDLPRDWNWLVGVDPRPKSAKIAHFTLGGPWLADWKTMPHDEVWNLEKSDYDIEMEMEQQPQKPNGRGRV